MTNEEVFDHIVKKLEKHKESLRFSPGFPDESILLPDGRVTYDTETSHLGIEVNLKRFHRFKCHQDHWDGLVNTFAPTHKTGFETEEEFDARIKKWAAS